MRKASMREAVRRAAPVAGINPPDSLRLCAGVRWSSCAEPPLD
jgi:hypothetical protein